MTKHEYWRRWLEEERSKPYYKQIYQELRKLGKDYLIFPDRSLYERVLDFPNIEDIKIIITDSQPTVEPYAADGLAWSSLDLPTHAMQGLYRKLYDDLRVTYDQSDHKKDRWAEQGVLLLNMELTSLSTPEMTPTIWEGYTLSILQALLLSPQPRFFLFFDEQTLWSELSNPHRHMIVRGEFNGRSIKVIEGPSDFFRKIDTFTERHYSTIIDWR